MKNLLKEIAACLLFVGNVLFWNACSLAQAPSIDAEQLLDLEGKTVDVVLTNGEIWANRVVSETRVNEEGDGLRVLKLKRADERKSKTVPLNRVSEVFYQDLPLDVSYERKRRSLIHDAEKRKARETHQDEVAKRLADQRHRYWPILDSSNHAEYMDKHQAFVQKCKSAMPELNLQTVETQYYIFTTDLAPDEVNGYLAYLDEMYRQLCKAFGVSEEKNIWCGKCVVVTFRDKANYLRFEKDVMGVDGEGSQGLCHQSSDGTVIFAGYKGSGGFGHVLVHETTHGFMHRYMTSARIPSWLNEGISDWMANAVVKGTRGKVRARQSALLAKTNGGIGNFLTVDRIPAGTYGTACSMVELLIARDRGQQFKTFIVLLKEGIDPETALQESFGLTYRELEAMYLTAIRNVR